MKYTFLESSDDTLLEKIYQFMWRGTPKNRWVRGVTASRCVSLKIIIIFLNNLELFKRANERQ